jgi:hypothetical protein
MNYLLYIEHSAENLQFFLWYRDYAKRFDQANTADIALAPEWTDAQHEAAMQATQVVSQKKVNSETTAEMFKDTDFEKIPRVNAREASNPFSTPPRTAADVPSGHASTQPWDSESGLSNQGSLYTTNNSNPDSYHQLAGEAFAAAGLKQPCKYS